MVRSRAARTRSPSVAPSRQPGSRGETQAQGRRSATGTPRLQEPHLDTGRRSLQLAKNWLPDGGVSPATPTGPTVRACRQSDAEGERSLLEETLLPGPSQVRARGQEPRARAAIIGFGARKLREELCAAGFDCFVIGPTRWDDGEDPGVLSFDLLADCDRRQVLEILRDVDVSVVVLRPILETFVRAQGRRNKDFQGSQTVMRTERHPLGVPSLQTADQRAHLRVCAENDMVGWFAHVAEDQAAMGKLVILEAPQTSLFWKVPSVKDSTDRFGAAYVAACMYGGTRDKVLQVVSSDPAFTNGLGRKCDNKHSHVPYGALSQAEVRRLAAELPTALNAEFARRLAQLCDLRPARLGGGNSTGASAFSLLAAARVATGRQPRGARAAPLLPEYCRVIQIPLGCEIARRLEPRRGAVVDSALRADLGGVHLPEGARLVRVIQGEEGPAAPTPRTTRGTFQQWDREDPRDVYIGRAHRDRSGRVTGASKFANPFKVAACTSRSACLDLFRSHLRAMKDFPRILESLRGKRLICHCRCHEACHADVIISELHAAEQARRGAVAFVGIPWGQVEFAERMLEAQHPFDEAVVDDIVKVAIAEVLRGGAAATRDFREHFLAKWQRRAGELEEREAELHSSMRPSVRKAMEGKRLLLLHELLAEFGVPGRDLLHGYLVHGFPISGALPATGLFPRTATLRTPLPVEELERRAPRLQQACVARVTPSGDRPMDDEVWRITLEEVQAGHLVGPLSPEDLSARFGSTWVAARRFGLRQGQKTRAIDDYSAHGQNSTFAAAEVIDMSGVDGVAAVTRAVMEAACSDAGYRFTLSSGEVLEGPVHLDFKAAGARRLHGRVFDLKAAYRQCARAKDDEHLGVVAVWDPHAERCALFLQPVLPFGATGSVSGFCFLARCLQLLLVKALRIFATHYVDDYPIPEFASLADHTESVITRFVEGLLGWRFKEAEGFAPIFSPLGVVMDLSGSDRGAVFIRNKPGRIEEIAGFVRELEQDLSLLTPSVARSLRGRLQFARGQLFARCGAGVFRLLGRVADQRTASHEDARQCLDALRRFVLLLGVAPPRVVSAALGNHAVLLTDGCSNPTDRGAPEVGIGAVLFLAAAPPRYFGVRIPAEFLLENGWASSGSDQLVYYAELLPIVVAKVLWAELLVGSPLVLCIDNDAARHSIVAGGARDSVAAELVGASAACDLLLGIRQWATRVPTAANISDGPSRLEFDVVASIAGSLRCDPLLAFGGSWGALGAELKRLCVGGWRSHSLRRAVPQYARQAKM